MMRVLLYSGAAALLLSLVIVGFAVRDARSVTHLSEEVKLHYRPLAESAYEMEISVFELGAATVNYLAERDSAELRVVIRGREAMRRALDQYDRYARIRPLVSSAETNERLHRLATEYLTLADSLVAIAARAPRATMRPAPEERALSAFSGVQQELNELLDREIQPQAIASWHGTADLARVAARRTAWVISILAPLALLIAAYAIFNTAQAYMRTRRLHEEAQRLSRQKTEFASITAHELRSPLTGMLGSLRLMKSGRAGILPETAIPYVDMASRNAVRLLTLINELLDLDRIEAGMMPFKDEELAADEIVRTSCDGLLGMAAELNVRIDAQSRTTARVRGDGARLQQVLVNLLSNALKHAPSDTTVLVRAEEGANSVRFSVRDFGPGIAAADRERIFQRFVQTGSASQHASTGLGLTVAREIVHRHKGTIGVESVVGQGATFWFELPRVEG